MRRWGLLLLLLAGCRRCTTASTPDAAAPSASASGSAAASASTPTPAHALYSFEDALPAAFADSRPFGNDVRRAVCGPKPSDCVIAQQTPAGKDAAGNELIVVTTRPGSVQAPDPLDPGDPMEARTHWLVARKKGVLVSRARVAQEWVQVTRKIGETLTVTPGSLETKIDFWPTSTWQSWPERKFRLDPLELVSFAAMPQHLGDPSNSGSVDVDFGARSGNGFYACGARRAEYFPIPSVRTVGVDPKKGLGRCAIDVDGSAHHGWIASGAPDAASGHLRVTELVTVSPGPSYQSTRSGALYVEVHDDVWTAGDELRILSNRPTGFMACDDPLTEPKQWIVDMRGVVTPPHGMTVELLRDDPTVKLFRIQASTPGIALVQRDDDADGRPARMIWTIPPNAHELGDTADIAEVACVDTATGPAIVPLLDEN